MRKTLLAAALAAAAAGARADCVDYVLPLMGTETSRELSCGNLYPAICRPWGMNFWTPQTGPMGDGWIYKYDDRRIRGFRQTHQPSPWVGDWAQFAVMPTVGKEVFAEDARASWFTHKTEKARPHAYSVYLGEHDVTFEMAPTCRAVAMRATYPETDAARFVVDAFDEGSAVFVDAGNRRVTGWSTKRNVRWNEKEDPPPVITNYFVVAFDRPFAATVYADGAPRAGATEAVCGHAGAIVTFPPTKKGERVEIRAASSLLGPEQAERNLLELPAGGYDAAERAGRAAWNDALGRIAVPAGDLDRLRVFYTCLYRASIFPQTIHEEVPGPDGAPRKVHFSPSLLRALPGPYYAGTGFWDTFRALFPLLNLIRPEVNADIMEGLANAYAECGWIPEWSSPGLRHCMIGNNSASVVNDAFFCATAADAAREDVYGKLYEGLLHGANDVHPRNSHVGRNGAKDYNALGYVPRDAGIRESAARTLEYAYDDWCIARLARSRGRPEDEVALYTRRSGNWRNLFDPARGWIVGRARDGAFNPDFDPVQWGGDFTEGNSMQYSWSVFHDLAGLAAAMGGRAAFARKLDDLFGMPPVFEGSYYNGMTHEIREMQVAGFGQYAHGNQPIQHGVYLYAWCGQPWKGQRLVRDAIEGLYTPTPDGYCGDEDNGQTSAWLVWSSLGFYPVCPGTGEYVLGAPYFEEAAVTLPGGRTLVVRAPGVSGARRYVSKVTLNGREIARNYVTRAELLEGGTLVFEMSETPDTARGTRPGDEPYSYSVHGLFRE